MKKINKKKILIMVILIIAIAFIIVKVTRKDTNVQTDEQTKSSENQVVEANVNTNQENETNALEEKLKSGKYLSENGLPVLMYHFFYDKSKDSGKDGNWIEISNFEEQMKYLSENNFYFPTWEQVENYIDGNQELPEKSIVITVDDGDPSFFELAVPIIQKYKIPVTSFVITYWYGDRANDKQKYVDYESHSYDMHKAGKNGKGVMLSWDYDKIKDDVLLSSEVLGGANIFCYPFGQYNDLDMKVLKENGYKLAFTTKAGRVKKSSSKYELPRVRISGNTSLSEFIKKVE
jgi:peptidoglycan/xylan/chitin deacetylase (PgdA/CDA1 family)